MVSALVRRTWRLLGAIWVVAVLAAAVALFAAGRTPQGVAALVVGLLGPLIVGWRLTDLGPRTPAARR